mgnify:CR=1 FL=1
MRRVGYKLQIAPEAHNELRLFFVFFSFHIPCCLFIYALNKLKRQRERVRELSVIIEKYFTTDSDEYLHHHHAYFNITGKVSKGSIAIFHTHNELSF